MIEIKSRGGGRIGRKGTSLPLVTLKLNSHVLELIYPFIGTIVFTPKDILSIEVISYKFRKALKIKHRINTYNEEIIFSPLTDAEMLLDQIQQVGFLSNKVSLTFDLEAEIRDRQATGESPFRRGFFIGIIVLLNLCLLYDMYKYMNGGQQGSPFGMGYTSGLISSLQPPNAK